MLREGERAQQRIVNIPTGAGPQATRSGRPLPRTAEQNAYLAREELAKPRLREAQDFQRSRRMDALNKARPIVRRTSHIMGEGRSVPETERYNDTSDWSQLRRRGEGGASREVESSTKGERRFTEGRAEREEQSRFARYTPLGRTSQSDMPRRERIFQPNRGILDSESATQLSRKGPQPRTPPSQTLRDEYRPQPNGGLLELESAVQQSKKVTQPLETKRFEVKEQPSKTQVESDSLVAYSPLHDTYIQARSVSDSARTDVKLPVAKEVVEDGEGEQETRERRRKKARRGKAEDLDVTYGKKPKGEDRDKARRRQHFVQEEDEDAMESAQEDARLRAEAKAERKRQKALRKPVPIMLPEFISVSNLAIALRVRQEEFVAKMEELGFEEVQHDFILNAENAGLIAMEYNFEPIVDRGESEDLKAVEPAEDSSMLPSRPPVVTIMGHVDHGKTTILDYLRKSSVAATEHGGITQHIGAFSVPMPSGKTITFLDTPGHAAFLSMRQRGANVTDIVILVVAADDSVMPQTIEAINHAKAAKVPIIVAVNKIDKEDSDVDKVKQDLARHGVDVEDFGGDTQVVCVSGKTGQGMDKLEEAAVALSDILDMRADRECSAEGWVIEASIKSMGKCATVLVRRGTMRPGDFIVAGTTWARIRCLRNEAGVDIEEAGPGTPVEIDGWREQPLAGDEVLEAPDESKAKSVVDYRVEREERNKLAEDMEAINEHRKVEADKKEREKLEAKATEEGIELELPEQKVGGPKEIYFIVKGDVSGSVEAVVDSIATLGNKEVHPYILRSGVGQVSEFDVEHASAAKGHIINFNTEVEPSILRAAEVAKVQIIDQNIIYRLVDQVKAELSNHLPPLVTQRVLGEAEIAQVFSITVKGRQVKNIAGCKVRNGIIAKNAKVRVLRKGEKLFEGKFPHQNLRLFLHANDISRRSAITQKCETRRY